MTLKMNDAKCIKRLLPEFLMLLYHSFYINRDFFHSFFQNNVLPSGEKTLEGLSIVIQDVTRHHSGIYMCTADNQVGQPDTAEIDLKVLCKYLLISSSCSYCIY